MPCPLVELRCQVRSLMFLEWLLRISKFSTQLRHTPPWPSLPWNLQACSLVPYHDKSLSILPSIRASTYIQIYACVRAHIWCKERVSIHCYLKTHIWTYIYLWSCHSRDLSARSMSFNRVKWLQKEGEQPTAPRLPRPTKMPSWWDFSWRTACLSNSAPSL